MKKFKKILLVKEDNKTNIPNTDTFIYQPLEKGMGITIGNALRRTLLSSISSYVPFAVKFEGVSHEFTTISGIEESVLFINSNLKKLIFRVNADIVNNDENPIELNFSIKHGVFTGKDIDCPTGVEVVNVDEYLATNNGTSVVKGKLWISQGRGYVGFAENKILHNLYTLSDIIYIDSLYSPITKVSFDVNPLNNHTVYDHEELRLTVSTNGLMTPEEAVLEAISILESHLMGIKLNHTVEEEVSNTNSSDNKLMEEKEEVAQNPLVDCKIEHLDLSIRTYKALKRYGIVKISEITQYTKEKMSKLPSFGKKSIEDLEKELAKKNLSFKSS